MISVYFVIFDDAMALDFTDPPEALRMTNKVLKLQGKEPLFEVNFCNFTTFSALSVGLRVDNLKPLPTPDDLQPNLKARPNDKTWIVLTGMPGECFPDPNTEENKQLVNWLQALPLGNQLDVLTICTGIVYLGFAGLLTGRRATPHQHHIDQLAEIATRCHVLTDSVFVDDGDICSSAGVLAGIDMMIHKIAQACDEVVASEVAQWMVMPHRRTQNDKQRSPLLAHRSHLHPAVHRVQEAISMKPCKEWDLETLSAVAHTSPRNLTRLFKEHTDISQMNYVSQVRVNLAKNELATGLSVTEVAAKVGFNSDVQLRRAWKRFGEVGNPSEYRAE